MRKTSWRVVQAIAGAVILFFVVRTVLANWDKVRQQPVHWQLHWEYVAASLIVTWAMYGALIWGWRALLQGWRQPLRIVDAARIWTISSLGKYIPGKLWSIAGMAAMAQRRGVAPVIATGSAVVMQLVSVATGTMFALALTGTVVLDRLPGGSTAALVFGIVALLSAVALTAPAVTDRIGFLLRRPDAVRAVDPNTLAAAVFANVVAWAGYGLALQLLALGTQGIQLSWATATGAFAAAYVVGYITLLLPAGLGVREGVLVLLLRGVIGEGPAIALAASSRIVLTINELGAALPFLLMRRTPDDR